ncbi:similar to Saccharomyces cerevisiae YMR187C Putative protein of unknown function [Maudiozyma barnettii]|uniref:Uncharacterized protein n=1 Tax=Maudiozyma barnettii TaxID=61262 RepID=A0A8H2ZJK2_9SACH|nr:hypothetical protein [Kazachstania barnettii]CAB4254317.1 similar to Saccharomyces cerevisiae YMR187C Putative protein of unknown function [Kazachstania barnettii]CAD1782145.1 similar to Saccharomyces cerevisiae YMR187C Putative protein of unknown function [Kazachstania barnettii]
MLFWNTLRKQPPTSYTCWICLEEEVITDNDIKFKWIKHSCGCNLEIHKICYLKYLNNMMEKSYIEEIHFDGDVRGPNITIYDLNRIHLFDFVDTNKKLSQDSNTLLDILPKSVRRLISIYLQMIKLPFLLLGPNPFEGLLSETFQDNVHTLTNIPSKKCPQCKRNFIPSNTKYLRGSSTILSIYFKIQKVIQHLIPLGLGISVLTNPSKLLLKLGLYQLRTLFPESILRTILNISSTKALDVYTETFNGIHSISKFNKFLIMGFPCYLLSLVKNQSSMFEFSGLVLDDFELMYPFLFMLHLRSYEDASISTISLISNCVLFSKITLYIYRGIIKPYYKKRFYNKWLSQNNVTPQAYFKEHLQPTNKDFGDPSVGITARLIFDYYCSLTTYCDELARASVIWPTISKYFSNTILDKLAPSLNILPVSWLKYTSPDEIKMCLNFTSYGIVGSFYFLFKGWLAKQRISEIGKLNKLVDRVIEDSDDTDTSL